MRTSLRSGGLGFRSQEGGFNPMEGMSNLADCMLVLACGLMLALVMYWNLDVAPAMDEVEMDTDLTELPSDLEEAQTDAQVSWVAVPEKHAQRSAEERSPFTGAPLHPVSR